MALTYDFAGDGALSTDWTKTTGGAIGVTRQSGVGKLSEEWYDYEYLYVWNTNQPPNDQYAQIDLGGYESVNNKGGPAVRCDLVDGDGYSIRASNVSGLVYIWRWDDGSSTQLAYGGEAGAATYKLIVTGTGLSALKDDVEQTSTSDETYSSGYAGFFYYGYAGEGNQLEVDDWEASDGGAAATAIIIPKVMYLNRKRRTT